MKDITLRVLDIMPGTSVDGPGLRTSIYFAGCAHECPGCHNPQSWDFNAGSEMTVDEIMSVVEENGFNVTFSGGDPLYQISSLTPLAEAIAAKGYTIWLYTGFTFEQAMKLPDADRLFAHIEAVVDGPFMADKRDTSLAFRGSSNQRIIYLNDSARGQTCM